MTASPLPSRSNGYTVPNEWELTADNFNQVFNDLAARLEAAEAIRAEFQALIDAGTGQALAVIQENVAPKLAEVEQTILNLKAEIAAAEDQIANIISNGVTANGVSETATRVFVTPEQRQAIDEIPQTVSAATEQATAQSATDTLILSLALLS